MEEAVSGKPWLIDDIKKELNGEKIKEKTNKEKLEIIKEHYNLEIEQKGEYIGIREMRKHVCWYLKNLKNSSEIREKINKLETVKEVINTLKEYFNNI